MEGVLQVNFGAVMSSLGQWITQENQNNLERTQKTFLKLVLEEDYKNDQNALDIFHLETLEKRRKDLTLRFAQTSSADGLLLDLFPVRKKPHRMKTRNKGKFRVFSCKYWKIQKFSNLDNAEDVKQGTKLNEKKIGDL